MKPKFIFTGLLLALISLSAFAQKAPATKPQTAFRFSETFNAIVIENDLTVVLTQGTSNEITVEGNANDIVVTEARGTLHLTAKSDAITSSTKVYVPANAVYSVYLNGNVALRSASVLPNENINIYMAAEANVNVRSNGRITVETADGIRFVKAR